MSASRSELEFVDLTKPRSAGLSRNQPQRAERQRWSMAISRCTESNAIMQYIASQKPNSLWPNDARARADIMRWQCWQLAHWGGEACVPLVFNRLVKKILNHRSARRGRCCQGNRGIQQRGRTARGSPGQAAVSGRQGGDACRFFGRCATLLYAKEAELPLGPYSHVQEWLGRVSALPCWRETAPQRPAAAA